MKPMAIKVGMACLCYDEKMFELYCQSLVPGGIFHSRLTETDYFGYVDDKNGTAHVFIRGTDNWLGWIRNFLVSDTDADGAADGFEMSAELFLKKFKNDLAHFDNIRFYCHSAGSGIAPIIALDLSHLPTRPIISGNAFASPPPGNEMFAKEFRESGILWTEWRMKGDLINTKLLRNQKSAIFDGEDVGKIVDLPQSSWRQSVPIFRVWAHSPKMICDSSAKAFPEEKQDLKWVKERCVN